MRRTFLSLCMAGFLTALASAPAAAATLRIEFDDFDVAFNGYALTDSDTVDGGKLAADALQTMDFYLDNHFVGSLSNTFADMVIGTSEPMLAPSGAMDAYGGYLTLYTNNTFDAGVALNFTEIDLIFNTVGQPPRLKLAGFGTASLLEQALPFNLAFDPAQPIDVLFIVNLANVEAYNGYISSFTGTGTGSVQGEANVVPEPTSMILLGTGLLGAIGARRRANRNAQGA